MPEALAWPPKKEDLERMYLVERMSAAKIAQAYGLKYKSPKVAESTVLYQLRRNGIARRDRAEHIRKVTAEMADSWVTRYEAGESLKQIAGDQVDPVSVWNHLRARGVKLRDKVEAQIEAVTIHRKNPFRGGLVEKAYLLGLCWGDIYISRHGRAIRAKTASTHPSMINLFEVCFHRYAHVLVFPVFSKMAGYEWAVQADLDQSFGFLLEKYGEVPDWVLERKRVFLSFVAGLFDAEGSIWLRSTGAFDFELSITNANLSLLETVRKRLVALGFDARITKNRDGRVWRIEVWNPHALRKLLKALPVRHQEKKSKVRLALKIQGASGEEYESASQSWEELRNSIRMGRDKYVERAEDALADVTGAKTTG